jgi:hypothetical protein
MMQSTDTRTVLTRVAVIAGALAVLATGADHLEEYTVNQFSTVPTIGTLFLLNFIAATLVGVGLLLPLRRIAPRFADVIRALLALAGIGIAATSLLGLWISEQSSLFGFTDHGFRPAIVAAIASEVVAVIALGAYLALAGVPLRRRPRQRTTHSRRSVSRSASTPV